ncbi:hypothetical protein J3D48_003618 [Pseudomonas fluorescens]|jgi:hypothetical protein|nr:hypothetical protein [Pseudomonas fluorescens]
MSEQQWYIDTLTFLLKKKEKRKKKKEKGIDLFSSRK